MEFLKKIARVFTNDDDNIDFITMLISMLFGVGLFWLVIEFLVLVYGFMPLWLKLIVYLIFSYYGAREMHKSNNSENKD